MKKLIRFIAIFLGVIILGLLMAAIFEPNDVVVTRTILIKAPKDVVFEQIVKFRNWPHWSPFYELDTTATYIYNGTDGTEGSSYSWVSKKRDVGAGTMTNTGVTGTTMNFHVDFEKPFKNSAQGYIKVSDSANMTKVTWTFTTHVPFPLNAMQAFPFLSMNKMVGNSFDHGLEKMKVLTEKQPVVPAVTIKEIDYPGAIVMGARKTVAMNDISTFFSGIYDLLQPERAVGSGSTWYGLYYTWDTVSKTTDMVAGFPVGDSTQHTTGITYTYVPPAKAYMASLNGSYAGEMNIHAALQKHLAAKGQTHSMVMEEYIAGPKNEPDTAKWVTNVYYFIR